MNLERVDLNLLIYLDVLLREKNVTRAAENLGITQPAMSNILKRLRDVFEDPLLIRSSEGMTPTERARELQPRIREALDGLNQIFESQEDFRPRSSARVFRIMAADYAEDGRDGLVMKLLIAEIDRAPVIPLAVPFPHSPALRARCHAFVDRPDARQGIDD